jgi:hypothetical protein
VTATGTAVGNVKSPETYFGSERNQYLQNGKSFSKGEQKLSTPKDTNPNALTLGGTWNFESEFAENKSADAEISYHYFAPRVFFVASAPETIKVKILRDGKPLTTAIAGDDVYFENGNSYVNIHADRLYNLIQDTQDETDHTLMMIIEQPGLKAFTFTFG